MGTSQNSRVTLYSMSIAKTASKHKEAKTKTKKKERENNDEHDNNDDDSSNDDDRQHYCTGYHSTP